MNQEIKSRWVEALRSGNYKQGQRALRAADQYCCLGVLCDIQGAEWVPEGELFSSMEHYSVDGIVGSLPKGFTAGVDVIEEISLSIMNDKGHSFHEIATYIEENL